MIICSFYLEIRKAFSFFFLDSPNFSSFLFNPNTGILRKSFISFFLESKTFFFFYKINTAILPSSSFKTESKKKTVKTNSFFFILIHEFQVGFYIKKPTKKRHKNKRPDLIQNNINHIKHSQCKPAKTSNTQQT